MDNFSYLEKFLEKERKNDKRKGIEQEPIKNFNWDLGTSQAIHDYVVEQLGKEPELDCVIEDNEPDIEEVYCDIEQQTIDDNSFDFEQQDTEIDNEENNILPENLLEKSIRCFLVGLFSIQQR